MKEATVRFPKSKKIHIVEGDLEVVVPVESSVLDQIWSIMNYGSYAPLMIIEFVDKSGAKATMTLHNLSLEWDGERVDVEVKKR